MNWISEFLPNDLPPNSPNDTRVYFYNFDSYWKRDAVRTRLQNLGNGLLEHIKGIRQSEQVKFIPKSLGLECKADGSVLGAKPEPSICRIQLWRSGGQTRA